MKKILFAAALLAATITASANATNVVSNDSIVVINGDTINTSADDALMERFINTEKEFERKSSKSSVYEDRTVYVVGNDATRVSADRRIQRGFYLGLGGSLTGTMGENALWGPKVFVAGGYEGNKWGLHASLGFMQIKPNEQSDFQGKVKALDFNFGLSRSLWQTNDHHTRLEGYGEVGFRTSFDRQDLGRYESVNVEETETEIITTTERGWRAYSVKPFMFEAEAGLMISHQFYKSPLGIYAKAGAGFVSQIAGKESVNGSADGIEIGRAHV